MVLAVLWLGGSAALFIQERRIEKNSNRIEQITIASCQLANVSRIANNLSHLDDYRLGKPVKRLLEGPLSARERHVWVVVLARTQKETWQPRVDCRERPSDSRPIAFKVRAAPAAALRP